MSERYYQMTSTPLLAQIDAAEPFMRIAGIPVKVHSAVPNDDMWAVEDDGVVGGPLNTRVVPNTFVVTRDVGPMLDRYRKERFAAGWMVTVLVVSQQTAHALLSCAEWWQARGDDPIWPIPASRLVARARVGQQEIDHGR